MLVDATMYPKEGSGGRVPAASVWSWCGFNVYEFAVELRYLRVCRRDDQRSAEKIIMCELFIKADKKLWQSRSKSVRINNVVTSVRLERFYWETLDEIAFRDGLSVTGLIRKLYLESIEEGHNIGSFTSFLRVCCSRYLSLVADGNLIRHSKEPISEIDAGNILKQETIARDERKSLYAEADAS